MKKKVTYLLTTFVLCIGMVFSFNVGVKAAKLDMGIYQGSSASPGTGYNKGSCQSTFDNGNALCRFRLVESPNQFGIRISFVYIDTEKGIYRQLGDSIDIWRKEPYFSKNIKTTPSNSGSKVNQSPLSLSSFTSTGYTAKIWKDMQYNSGWLKRAFYDEEVLGDLANQMIPEVKEGLSDSYWNQFETEFADAKNPAKKGLRFFIEPIRGYAGSDDSYYVMTLSEFARLQASSKVNKYTWWNFSGDGIREEWLFMSTGSEFLDVGVNPIVACTSNSKCSATDVYTISKGHALQIIDFSKFVRDSCDYETGKGFPVDKQRGDKLTSTEEKCCEEKLTEIQNKYKTGASTSHQCMSVSDSVPSFINCMSLYFQGTASQQQQWEQQKQELMEFDRKYPACSVVGCEFQPLNAMEERYETCVQSMNIIDWMNSIILCEDTTCEINYKADLYTYKENHLYCDTIEWESKIATSDCKILTPGCDEDNPNHFPKEGDKNPDMTCCIEFEEEMKIKYSQQGLSQEEIDQKIEDWFFEPGKEFRQNCLRTSCNINDTTLTEECCEELMQEYPEYPEEFWIGKGCQNPQPPECTWHDYADELIEQLKKMLSADCSMGSEIITKASDTQNWVCIFSSDELPKGTKEEVFIDYYLKYNNPYCSVYCREDVKYDFPDGSMIVKAGSHFTVGETGYEPEWKSIQFSSSRECKTYASTNNKTVGEIDTEQFEKDWEKANDKVIKAWDAWKIAQDQQWSIDHAEAPEEPNCDPKCETVCDSWEPNKRGDGDVCVSSHEECEMMGYRMIPKDVYYASFGSSSKNVKAHAWCTTDDEGKTKVDPPDPKVEEKRQAFLDAVEELETIEDDILACTSWDKFGSYRHATFDNEDVKATRYAKYSTYSDFYNYKNFSPDVTIDYQEPTHSEYDYNDLLEKKETVTVKDSNLSVSGKQFTIKYNCPEKAEAPNLESCTKSIVFEYSSQKEAHATYYKEIKYTLQDGVFETILKPQGTAIKGSAFELSSNQITFNLGYSALHVHFMTPTGRYDIGLSYPGFTPSNNPTKMEHNFDKLVDDSYNYDCTYQVHNEIIENDDPDCVGDNCEPCSGDNCKPCAGDNCDPTTLKGLNLVYRPISLGEPFPGINGEGRTPGTNWNDTNLIENFITNNRGVNGSAIYTKEPMYQITLTPALIQKIRKYNESTTYNDFNMDCTSDGLECKSYFIRGNVEDSTYNFSNYFQTCKIAGNRGSTTCCGVGNWNDCDDRDGITRR